MKKNVAIMLFKIFSLNLNFVFNFFILIYNIILNIAAVLLNLYFLFELFSRVVIFFYYVKNIIYFIYVNQKKQILEKNTPFFYSDINIFFKIYTRAFNYSFLYTFIDYVVISFKETNVYIQYKLFVIEKIYMFISNLFEFETNILNLKFDEKTKFSKYKEKIKFNIFTKLNLFVFYSFYEEINKLSYIYSNNLFNLKFFTILIDYEFTSIEGFLNVKVKETVDYIYISLYQEIAPLASSIYIGYYKNFIFSLIYYYNIIILFQFNFILNHYKKIQENYYFLKFNKNFLEWDYLKFEMYYNFYFYINKITTYTIDNIVNFLNDIQIIIYSLDENEDFTIFDLIKYIFFVKDSKLITENNFFFSEVIDNFFYIKKEIKFFYFYVLYYLINNLKLFIYSCFNIYFVFFSIRLLFFFLKKTILTLFSYSNLYINFFKEIYQAIVYFCDFFYYFVTSSFYSEHIFVIILIEFFLEIFGLSLNSIEFVISIIFVIIASIIASQFIDFFENHNINLLLETFSLFFFCFSFLYEQQKVLLKFLISKLKSYKSVKYLLKMTSKFYEINKQNIKIAILLEKIKKIKIK